MPLPPRRQKRGLTGRASHRPVSRFWTRVNTRKFQAALDQMAADRDAVILDVHRRLGGRLPASHQDKVAAVTVAAAARGYDQPVWGWAEPGWELEGLVYAFFSAYLERYGSRYLDEL